MCPLQTPPCSPSSMVRPYLVFKSIVFLFTIFKFNINKQTMTWWKSISCQHIKIPVQGSICFLLWNEKGKRCLKVGKIKTHSCHIDINITIIQLLLPDCYSHLLRKVCRHRWSAIYKLSVSARSQQLRFNGIHWAEDERRKKKSRSHNGWSVV